MHYFNSADDFDPYVTFTTEDVTVELSDALTVRLTRQEWDALLDAVAVGQMRHRRERESTPTVAVAPVVPDTVPEDLTQHVCWSLASAERLLGVPRAELLEVAGLDESCPAAQNPTLPLLARGSLDSWRELIG